MMNKVPTYFTSQDGYAVINAESAPPREFHNVIQRSIAQSGVASKSVKAISERYAPGLPVVGVKHQVLSTSDEAPSFNVPESANKLTMLIFAYPNLNGECASSAGGVVDKYTLPVYFKMLDTSVETAVGFTDRFIAFPMDLKIVSVRLSSLIKEMCSDYTLQIYYLVHEKEDSDSEDDDVDAEVESITSSGDGSEVDNDGAGPANDSDDAEECADDDGDND